jgi:hypothetical protein
MAEPKPGIEGNVAGKPISSTSQQKIQDVLKSTLQAELSTSRPATVVASRHGSVTHGSVIFEE